MFRLILHPSGPKTASFYSQVLLAQETERLLQSRVFVPEGEEISEA